MSDTTTTAPAPRLGNVKDAAALLGCSVKHVRRLIDMRRLPGVIRLGRLLRVDLVVLNKWVDQGCPSLARFSAKGGQ
jgi:excisionase family DNA binding protein